MLGSPQVSFVLVTQAIVVLSHTHGRRCGRGAGCVRVLSDRIATESLLIVALLQVIGQKLVTLTVNLLKGLADSNRAYANLVRNLV